MIKDKIKKKTTAELEYMIENSSDYQVAFVEAAIIELKHRSGDHGNEKETVKKNIDEENVNPISKEESNLIKVDSIHKNIKIAIKLLIITFVFRSIQIAYATSDSSISIGFINIPFFKEIISFFGLGLIIYMLHNGYIQARLLFLIGFILTLFPEGGLTLIVLLEASVPVNSKLIVGIFFMLFTTVRLLAIYFLYNKTTNGWYREIKTHPNTP